MTAAPMELAKGAKVARGAKGKGAKGVEEWAAAEGAVVATAPLMAVAMVAQTAQARRIGERMGSVSPTSAMRIAV